MAFSNKRHSTDNTCYITLKGSFNDLKEKENALYFAFVIITDPARGSLETGFYTQRRLRLREHLTALILHGKPAASCRWMAKLTAGEE